MNEERVQLSLDLMNEHFSTVADSSIWNPFYDKNILFFEGCAKPNVARNQLLGYLGAFSNSSAKLNSEIDICVMPFASYEVLENGNSDEVIKTINNKLSSYNKKSENYTNKIPNTLILSEKRFFKYISDNLLKNDQVKIDQFNRINFSFSL